jgi:hypothetical protein
MLLNLVKINKNFMFLFFFIAKDILEHDTLFLNDNKVNIPLLQEHLTKEGRIEISDIAILVNYSMALFRAEPNVLEISEEVRVVGDLHGVYFNFCGVNFI